ncbi:MAG: D-alanyl-D-alanine carboxypeptidase family protein [Eubacteriales bacterium]
MYKPIARVLALFLCAVLLSSGLFAAAYELPAPPDISSQAALMINIETGKTVYEKDSAKRLFPASAVKIMTGILVLESITDLTEQLIVSDTAVADVMGNNIGLESGEVMSVNDLLYALLVGGANDAANVLAERVGGSISGFVELMNKRAGELGCQDTHYTNPTGLHDDNMYTTASDVALIGRRAYSLNTFMEITSTAKHSIPATNKNPSSRPILNRNHFVSQAKESIYFYKYARGMNAGSTSQAGYCLTTTASQKGMTYICVILGASSYTNESEMETIYSFIEAKQLFDWIFSAYENQIVLDKKEVIAEVEVSLSANQDHVLLSPAQGIESLLPIGIDKAADIHRSWEIYNDLLVAPIKKGAVLGKITLTFEDATLGEIDLIAQSSVERSNVLYYLDEIKKFTNQRWFRASAVSLAIFVAFYIVIRIVGAGRNRRRRF